MALGTVRSCGVDSVSGKTPSELWNEVNADGQVTSCEASRLRAFHSEYTARLSGNSANAPRFSNEAEMNRELVALQRIAQYCSGGTNSCESVKDEFVPAKQNPFSPAALAMSAAAETTLFVVVGLVASLGLVGGITYICYKNGWKLPIDDVPVQ